MEKRSREAGHCGSLAASCLALAVALGLAATTAYLEASRNNEILRLKDRIDSLQKQYLDLYNTTRDLYNQIAALQKKSEEEKTTYYDDSEDTEYYDEDSYDDGEYRDDTEVVGSPASHQPTSNTEEKKNKNRTRRSVGDHKYNLIISQGPKRPSLARPFKVDAEVVIDSGRRGGRFEEHRLPGTTVYRPYSTPFRTSTPAYHQKSLLFAEQNVHNRNRHKGRLSHHDYVDMVDVDISNTSCNHEPVAAQYGGDTSRYKHTHHNHYDGNHRLYHPDGRFRDWSVSPWAVDMDEHFSLHSGELRILTSGLYYVYAQIFYADVHDTSGYRLMVNGAPMLQCTVTSLSQENKLKRNSCYTAGLLSLHTNDRIMLREIEGHRYTVFEPTKSFFGLFKVGKLPP